VRSDTKTRKHYWIQFPRIRCPASADAFLLIGWLPEWDPQKQPTRVGKGRVEESSNNRTLSTRGLFYIRKRWMMLWSRWRVPARIKSDEPNPKVISSKAESSSSPGREFRSQRAGTKRSKVTQSQAGLLQHGLAYCRHLKLVDEKGVKIFDALVSAAEGISARLAKSPGVFLGWLQDTIGALEPKHPEIPKSLGTLPWMLATLNYDGFRESDRSRARYVALFR
jgi:hypothetical protein